MVAGLLICALALTACGDSSGTEAGSPAQGNSGGPSDKTLVVGATADVGSLLDPRLQLTTPGRNLVIELFDGIVENNWYDPNRPFGLVPGLAKSWKISPDGKTYTFEIRRAVKFADGTPLDAKAIEFSWRTLLDKRFEYYFPKGAAASARNLAAIESFKATKQFTFEVQLKERFAPFLDVIAAATNLYIVSPAAIKKYGNDGIVDHPVGTGPFRLTEIVPGQRVTLERNDSYFRGPAGYKRLVFQSMVDTVARANALASKQINVAEDITKDYLEAWQDRSDVRAEVAPRGRSYMCWPKLQGDGPTVNRDFREALSLASDRNAINKAAFTGKASPARGYYPPGSAAYADSAPPLPFDLDKAKQLRAQSGLPANVTLTIETSSAFGSADVWNVWADNLRKIGVTVKTRSADATTWVNDLVGGLKPSSTVDALCGAVGSDSLWQLGYFASTAGFPEVGGYNPNLYDGAEKQFDAAKAARSQKGFVNAMRAADQFVARGGDYPLIYLLSDLQIEGLTSDVDWKPMDGAQQHSFYSARPRG